MLELLCCQQLAWPPVNCKRNRRRISSAPTTFPDGKLPQGVRLRLGSSKFRDANVISAASLSPDGKVIAVWAGQQTIHFLDVATGDEVRQIGIREYLRSPQIIWSADGKQIVTTGYNGINTWDAQSGKIVRQAVNANKDGRDGSIHVSADCKFAAIGSQYENVMIKIVDLTTGNQISMVKPAQNSTVQGAMSPKGEFLATWGRHYNRGNGKPEDDLRIARTDPAMGLKRGQGKAGDRFRHQSSSMRTLLARRIQSRGRRQRDHSTLERGHR